jgi:hypothetical protein
MNRSLTPAVVHGILVMALGLPAAGAVAAPEPWSPGPALQGADWSWSAPQDFDLPGARLRLLRFAARFSPDEAARRLALHAPRHFDRLQLSGPVLQLSGMQQGRHWLAQLGPGHGGTQGMVSSLSPQTSTVGSSFLAASFVPSGSRRVLRVSGRAARPDVLESYDCSAPLSRVAEHVDGALRRARWQPVSGAAHAISPGVLLEWSHSDGARLTVHIHPRAGSVALTFWHRPEAP